MAKGANGTGNLQCVWMAAGLVSYKLCDREYDCEHCPFDAAFRGVESGPESTEPKPRGAVASWDFPADRRYHASHSWLQVLDQRSVRYGVDIFVARLLDHLTSVVLPAPRTRLFRERRACWLVDEWQPIPFRALLNATVSRVNTAVQHDSGLVSSSPYEDGWLLELSCDRDPARYANLLSVSDARERARVQLARLEKLGMAQDARVGATLADGGEPIADLRGVFGIRRYHRLCRQLLG